MADLIGQTLGRYQIVELLGVGGMATVYKAYDTLLEREVAIKVIRTDAFPAEQLDLMLKRFEREAKTLARLSHPHIVEVIDYGEFEGSPYLVMVYLPGGTLKDRLGSPIPWAEAARMLIPVAHALEYAHEHSVINRDVKPSNILLTEEGQPMLTDFGLVKLLESSESTNLTSSGTGMGTPDYMAPEQWIGETTPQSDVYSLGVVLYEMITSHKPYTADTPAGILIKQATEPLPPPRYYVRDLPRNVETVLLKALERDPKNRYQNMRSFANALDGLILEQQSQQVISTAVVPKPANHPEPNPNVQTFKKEKGAVERRPVQSPVAAKKRSSSRWPIFVILTAAAGTLCVGVGLCGWFSSMNGTQATPSPIPTIPTDIPTHIPTPTHMIPTIVLPVPNIPKATATFMSPELIDPKGVPMRFVPAGDFVMGSDRGEADMQPSSVINLDGYYIDKYEVTNARYKECVNAGSCKPPKRGGSATRTSYFSSPDFENYPVIFVDWHMAKDYCEWRGARLPTEAEWEKAARGTDGKTYPWGEDLKCIYANYYGCTEDTTSVGLYEGGKSVYGVYDLVGNVAEWVSSLYMVYPYNSTDGREDLNASGGRVVRGGAWHFMAGGVNSDARAVLDPTFFGLYVGIRCAATP